MKSTKPTSHENGEAEHQHNKQDFRSLTSRKKSAHRICRQNLFHNVTYSSSNFPDFWKAFESENFKRCISSLASSV